MGRAFGRGGPVSAAQLSAAVAAVSPIGKQTIFIPADSMRPRTTGGCAAVAVEETATNKVNRPYLAFDGTTEEYAQFQVWMPKGWNESTVTFQPMWAPASGSGDVIWALQGLATSNDDLRDQAFGTAQTSTDTVIATTDVHIGPESAAITIGGTPAEGDWVTFQVYRDADAAGDTLNGVDAWLYGIKLFYTINAATDA